MHTNEHCRYTLGCCFRIVQAHTHASGPVLPRQKRARRTFPRTQDERAHPGVHVHHNELAPQATHQMNLQTNQLTTQRLHTRYHAAAAVFKGNVESRLALGYRYWMGVGLQVLASQRDWDMPAQGASATSLVHVTMHAQLLLRIVTGRRGQAQVETRTPECPSSQWCVRYGGCYTYERGW